MPITICIPNHDIFISKPFSTAGNEVPSEKWLFQIEGRKVQDGPGMVVSMKKKVLKE